MKSDKPLQLCNNDKYSICNMETVVGLMILLIIITISIILHPVLATTISTNLSDERATTYINEYNSFTLLPSIQSTGIISSLEKNNVTLVGLVDNLGNSNDWNQLLQTALDELSKRHPEMNIHLQYTEFPYNETRLQLLDRLSSGNPVDLVSVDQIWLGELAERGLLKNLTSEFEHWGKMSDLYQVHLAGSIYNNTLYGLWLWTDIRGMWYWKDMLQQAEVDPESLKTWDGYISSAVKLKEFFGDRVNQGAHLLSMSHDIDMWYPYLWMLGGEILELRQGHPTKGAYWFPAFNNYEGIRAMDFLKKQVDAGIEPSNQPGEMEFVNRDFPVMLGGSWIPYFFPPESLPTLKQQIGFIPMFPVPNSTIPTSTMMGGWELAVPSSSQNSDLAWELITIMFQPEILSPFILDTGYLPTQHVLGDGPSSQPLKQSVPYYEDMVSMIPLGGSRPAIPEYPEIAGYIHQAIQQVYNGTAASSKDALDIAAAKSAQALGW
jgi:multiple sugar transport system substrate-binding protein